MERCPTQSVLPLVGLAAEKAIRTPGIIGVFRGGSARRSSRKIIAYDVATSSCEKRGACCVTGSKRAFAHRTSARASLPPRVRGYVADHGGVCIFPHVTDT
ncbi:MAG: hypothetical protein R6U98_36925 [Pirellulaceae bacterium]